MLLVKTGSEHPPGVDRGLKPEPRLICQGYDHQKSLSLHIKFSPPCQRYIIHNKDFRVAWNLFFHIVNFEIEVLTVGGVKQDTKGSQIVAKSRVSDFCRHLVIHQVFPPSNPDTCDLCK